MLARIQASLEKKKQGDAGFTLIELLVVVIIIGILAGIATPIYLKQKQKAVDSSIQSDLRNLADAEETYAVDHQDVATQYSKLKSDLGIRTSNGNVIKIGIATDNQSYCIQGYNTNATANSDSKSYWFDSSSGGIVPGGAQGKPAASAAPTCNTVSTAPLG